MQNGGGGIYTSATTLTADNIVVSNNSSSATSSLGGGGIGLSGSTANISNSIISNNTSVVYGGGIAAYSSSTLNLDNSEVTNNKVTSLSYGYGGGIWADDKSNISLTDSTISKNTGARGAGIYASQSLIVDGSDIKENQAISYGGGVLVLNQATITNTNIINNTGNSAGGIYFYNNSSEIQISDCLFDGNYGALAVFGGLSLKDSTFTNNEGDYVIFASLSAEKRELVNCKISDNNTTKSTVHVLNGNMELTDCEISNNVSGYAGGFSVDSTSSTVVFNNCLVKKNQATDNASDATGGIYAMYGNLTFNDGAIYSNKTNGSTFANDMYISSKAEVSVIAADKMIDDSISFENYMYYDKTSSEKYIDGITTDNTKSRYLTVMQNLNRDVASIDGTLYQTLEEAIENAHDGAEILLIAGENDDYGYKIMSTNSVIDKDITINLNGRTISSLDSYVFTISENGSLTITGEGDITSGIELTGKSHLTLDSKIQTISIKLEENNYITFGNDFNAEEVSITLPDATVNNFNNDSLSLDDILVVENIGAHQNIVTILGLKNSLIAYKVINNNNLYLHKEVIEGIYIDGINGNDNNSGSMNSPVKTFAKAKELLVENNMSTVYVLGTITISDTQTWDLDGLSLMRYPGYQKTLVQISTSGNLTLQNIVIDGAADYGTETDLSLITVNTGGKLTVSDGTILQNNHSHLNSALSFGGAISANGTVTLNGGLIRNCTATYGGGIYIGTSAKLTMNKGTITENSATSGGGGIAISYNGSATINDGTISYNTSDLKGGGILVGGNTAMIAQGTPTLTMYGGTIDNNTAYENGGGIYIECNSKGTIYAGNITNNVANGKGSAQYSGGGIYINGGRDGYDDGILYLYKVIITENEAAQSGGGIAGCPTGSVYIYATEGAAIYGNMATGSEDIYITSSTNLNIAMEHQKQVYISAFMLGGGANNYVYGKGSSAEGELLPYNKYLHVAFLNAKNNPSSAAIYKALQQGETIIKGNYGGSNGGGIGTNGILIVGTDEYETVSITVTKVWEDEDSSLRPDSVKVWVVQNGSKMFFIELPLDDAFTLQDEEITWEDETVGYFVNLPKYDEDGNEYIYSVVEDMEGIKNYVSSVKESDTDEHSFTITNTYVLEEPAEIGGIADATDTSNSTDASDNTIKNPTTEDNILKYVLSIPIFLIFIIGVLLCRKKLNQSKS